MARNKVMKLWTAIVTAFIALCTTLGLVTTTAAAAVPQAETTRNRNSAPQSTAPATSARSWLNTALPPTMKQRIHAEAHGKSPSCRHRLLTDAATNATARTTAACPDGATSPAEPLTPPVPFVPLQR